MVSRICNEIRK